LNDPTTKGKFQVNHKSISLPILLRYELNENMFFVDLGPEFSWFLSSEMQSDYVELGNPNNETIDISDRVESYNIGACIRIGVKAHQWNIPIAVTASYHHGFKGVAVDDEWWSDWKIREITLSVSYLFDLSK
jgi:Outer membrane protein beta-barrel domain